MVGVSLVLTSVSLLESTNTESVLGSLFGYLEIMIIGRALGNPLGSLVGYISHIN